MVVDFTNNAWRSPPNKNLLAVLARHFYAKITHGKVATDGSPASKGWPIVYSGSKSETRAHHDFDWHILQIERKQNEALGVNKYKREHENFGLVVTVVVHDYGNTESLPDECAFYVKGSTGKVLIATKGIHVIVARVDGAVETHGRQCSGHKHLVATFNFRCRPSPLGFEAHARTVAFDVLRVIQNWLHTVHGSGGSGAGERLPQLKDLGSAHGLEPIIRRWTF